MIRIHLVLTKKSCTAIVLTKVISTHLLDLKAHIIETEMKICGNFLQFSIVNLPDIPAQESQGQKGRIWP